MTVSVVSGILVLLDGLKQLMYYRIVFVLLLLFILWRAGEATGLSLNTAAESNQTHRIIKVFQVTFVSSLGGISYIGDKGTVDH